MSIQAELPETPIERIIYILFSSFCHLFLFSTILNFALYFFNFFSSSPRVSQLSSNLSFISVDCRVRIVYWGLVWIQTESVPGLTWRWSIETCRPLTCSWSHKYVSILCTDSSGERKVWQLKRARTWTWIIPIQAKLEEIWEEEM